MKKIIQLSRDVAKITEEEIKEMTDLINLQRSYISPLKGKKQFQMNKLGEKNARIVSGLLIFRRIVLEENCQHAYNGSSCIHCHQPIPANFFTGK